MTTLFSTLPDAAPSAAAAPEPTEAALAAARRGDAGPLFETYKDWVWSVALHLSGDATEAADVAQDVFLKVLRRLRQFDGGARFTTWLYRIVLRTVIDRRRSRRATEAIGRWWRGRERAAPPPSPDEAAVRGETRDRVRAALASLAPDLRAPLTLRYVARLTYTEVGDVLGLPPGTVATRIRRGHRELGRRLRALDGESRP